MSMDFLDSCDHYNQNATIAQKWTVNILSGATSVANGRNGRGISLGAGTTGVGKTLTHQTGWVAGCAFYISADQGQNGTFYTAEHAGEVRLATVKFESDGTISIYAGNTLTL